MKLICKYILIRQIFVSVVKMGWYLTYTEKLIITGYSNKNSMVGSFHSPCKYMYVCYRIRFKVKRYLHKSGILNYFGWAFLSFTLIFHLFSLDRYIFCLCVKRVGITHDISNSFPKWNFHKRMRSKCLWHHSELTRSSQIFSLIFLHKVQLGNEWSCNR